MGLCSETARRVMETLRVVLTVEPIMFVLSMTIYMRTPASQLLILHKVCLQSYNATVCEDVDEKSADVENDVQASAAHWNFILKMALFIPGAIVSSLYGALSDRQGRRLFLIIPSLGSILGAVSFIFQTYFPMMSFDYLVASELAVGLSGNVVTAYIIAKSYLCDVTDSSNRTKRLGVMKAMSYFGGPVGAFLAGVLIDVKGFATVYFILAGIHVFVVLYVVFWLQETVDYESDQEMTSGDEEDGPSEDESKEIERTGDVEAETGPQEEAKDGEANDSKREEFWGELRDSIRQSFREIWKSLRSMLLVCFRERLGCRRKYLLLAMLIGIIHNICSSAEMDLIVLYTKHSPLNWSATTIGVFISVRTALKAVALALGLPAIFKIMTNHTMQLDLGLASMGIVSTSAALTMIAFAKSTAVMMTAAVVGLLVSFPSVAITSFKSKLVQPQEYGSLFAITALIQTLCSVASSGLFNNLYAALLPIWPGLPFLVTVALYVLSLLIVLYICYDVNVSSEEEELTTDRGPKYKELKNVEDDERSS